MSTTLAAILEIIKVLIPALIVIIAFYGVVGKFLKNETQRRQFEVYKNGQETTMRLRLQAYERLALFLERMHPRGLMSRSYQTGMTVRDFQFAMIQNIQEEYDHNVSQQIYVQYELWRTIQGVKEQTQLMINEAAAKMPPDISAKELQKSLTEYMLSVESLPLEGALSLLHQESKLVLQQQL